MASVFVYHVVGDLTVGKPELVEFPETDTVEAAIKAIGESTEGGIPVWKRRSHVGRVENSEMRQRRFVGILDSLDVVAFLARSECLQDQEKAMKTPVSEVVVPNTSSLSLVDPGTRLIDALEMMKQGVKRLLVPKSIVWKGMSKRFSIIYNDKWLKNVDTSNNSGSHNNLLLTNNANPPSSSSSPGTSIRDKFCCLSREDVIRFIIGCLGALAPLPLSSISSLGIINPNYFSIEASLAAMEATQRRPEDPRAIAIVEAAQDEQCKIVGEISTAKLWKCDYGAAAWALANLSAGQFMMGVEDNSTLRSFSDFQVNSTTGIVTNGVSNEVGPSKMKGFSSSRSIGFGFLSNPSSMSSMYRGRVAPLTCKATSSLAAVMTQMLSHRATHVWVETESEDENVLVGVVGYADILVAVTKHPAAHTVPPPRSGEVRPAEIQT